MRTPGRREAGFSLLELLVVGALLSLVGVMLAQTLLTSAVTSAEVHVTSSGSLDTGQVVNSMVLFIQRGTVLTAVSSTVLVLQEPVDPDADGEFFDATTGDLQLGAQGNLNWTYRYEWVPGGNVSEAANSLDINGDNDQNDTFRIGRIVRRVMDQNGVEQSNRAEAGGDAVLQPPLGQSDPAVPPIFAVPFDEGVEIRVTRLVPRPVQARDDRSVLFTSRRVVKLR